MLEMFDFLTRRVVTIAVVLAILLFLLGLGCADRVVRVALFHPEKFAHELQCGTFPEVSFQNSKKQTIHGCYFPYQKIQPNETPIGTILYSHGNGENVSQLLNRAEQMRSKYRCNVLVFDYAGYGKS
jgi:hypothetical protein